LSDQYRRTAAEGQKRKCHDSPAPYRPATRD
jgi:hypothetical protein